MRVVLLGLLFLTVGLASCQPVIPADLAADVEKSNPMAKVVSDKYSKDQIIDCAHFSVVATDATREAAELAELADINAAFKLLNSVFTGAYFLKTEEMKSIEDIAKQSSLYDVLDIDMMNTTENLSIDAAVKLEVCRPLMETIFAEHVE